MRSICMILSKYSGRCVKHPVHTSSASSVISALRTFETGQFLLANPRASITEVAFQVGFSGTSAFSAAFRRITGQTATDYRLSLE